MDVMGMDAREWDLSTLTGFLGASSVSPHDSTWSRGDDRFRADPEADPGSFLCARDYDEDEEDEEVDELLDDDDDLDDEDDLDEFEDDDEDLDDLDDDDEDL